MMDSDDEYDYNSSSRAGPLRIIDSDEIGDVNDTDSKKNSRGRRKRPEIGTYFPQSRGGIRDRGGRGGRNRRGDDRGRGSRGGGRGGTRRGSAGGHGQEGFDLRRYSSLGQLDTRSSIPSEEDANSMHPNNARQRRSASRPRQDRIFGYKKLEELSKKTNSDDILMEILSENSGFQTLLKKHSMNDDWSKLLISVLGKACFSSKSHSKLQLVGILVNENVMMLHVSVFLGKIQSKMVEISPAQLECLIRNICKIMKELMQRMPREAHSISSAVVMLNIIAQDSSFNMQHNQEILELINEVSLIKDTIVKDTDNYRKERNMQSGGKRGYRDTESMPPPDDFKHLPILPNLSDLQLNEKPFLRKNKVDGSYDDLHHYLDIQFRLLREDYIQPLRNGISEYRKGKKDDKQRFNDIRLYRKVRIIRPSCSNNGILHVIQFDVSKMAKMRWESSRRLLHGSLVCLSRNDFETIFFATVTNRDVKLLQQGLIEVQFKNNLQSVFEIKPSEEFVMAETTAYFEAYRHILSGLQEIEDGLPMQRYIVECKQALKPPKYLQNELHYYDFSPLLHREHSGRSHFPVINTRQWPSEEALRLDTSQYRALQMAVTKEMALIQGPPGTGKTFVGLKIMQLLLHNSDIWSRSEDTEEDDVPNDSILVVCYTNHALDQFLEGVSEFCDSIVRIGGRCCNPTLEPFMLSNLRKEARMKRQIPKLILERKTDCKRQMNQLKDKIEDASAKLDASRLGLIHEKTLELFIREEHYRELVSGRLRNKELSAIQYWLSSNLHTVLPQTKGATSTTSTTDVGCESYLKWIDNVINGPSFELDTVDILHGDLWTKELVERLYIYKQWIRSYVDYKQKCIDDINEEIQALVEGNKKSDKDKLQNLQLRLGSLRKDVQMAETSVMSENALKDGLRLEPRQYLDRLLKTKPQTHFNCSVVEHWLHIDDTSDSKGLFTDALEVMSSVLETIDTLEEAEAAELERNIVDKDDDEEISRSKTRELMLSRAMSDLSCTFTGEDNMTEVQGSNGQWKMAVSSKNTKQMMHRMLEQSQAMSEKEEARQPVDVWTFSVGTRFSLYKLWLSRYQDSLSASIQDIVQQYSNICDVYQEVMDIEDVDIISGSRVIAMTTTGAAKYRNILRSVNPKIIVVEEAAEVLESHIVSTINSNCQHLILIGDHKQLRPTPTVYQLAVHYNLEISLFERMIKNEMNYVTLELQHRMRPEISNHMKHLYPNLRDDPSVFGMKNVLGVDKNIYFIDHSFHETFLSETKSRSNSHEAEFIVALCKYLLQQGYLPTQVTVLTTYTGQVFALKKLMPKKEYEGVRVTAVDNYQGEENDIILLSLVRSNSDDNIGFLKTDNRACVALSRAKMGFYVIGNFSLLCSQSTLWTNIIQTLKENEAFGSYLVLKCQNHPDKTINASLKSAFSKAPNGGCTTPCNTRLSCGHVCEQFCHIMDNDHKMYRCLKPCAVTVCKAGHVCTKKCWQECGKCLKIVTKTIPLCGHSQSGPCHQDPLTFKCKSKCVKTLHCGHKCGGICGICKETKTHQLQCPELIERKLICGHLIQCKCFERNLNISCTQKCTSTLNCGHACSGTCGGCFQGRLHFPCLQKCSKMLICGHRCGQTCGEPCPPCKKKCGLHCEHSKCPLSCGQPCRNCSESCQWKCDHQRCTNLCYQKCNRIPCDLPCPERLECGHRCSGLCGEVCPAICYVCDAAKVKEIFKDVTPVTKFIVLEDCQHIVEKNTMDQLMFTDIHSSETFSPLEVKKCPTCSKPIYNSRRYGNVIKQSRDLINEVKQQLNGSERKILTRCQQMKSVVAKLQSVDSESFNMLMRKLEPVSQVTMASLEVVDIQRKLIQCLNDKLQTLDMLKVLQYQRMGMLIKVELNILKNWVAETKFKPNKTDIRSKLRQTFTPQELAEAGEEMLRLAYMVEVIRCADHSHMSGLPSLANQYVDIYDILNERRPMTQSLNDELIKVFKSLSSRDPSCQKIKEERCIPKSMNDFAQNGRWLKCNEANHLQAYDKALGTSCPRCMQVKSVKSDFGPQQKPSQAKNVLPMTEQVIVQRTTETVSTSKSELLLACKRNEYTGNPQVGLQIEHADGVNIGRSNNNISEYTIERPFYGSKLGRGKEIRDGYDLPTKEVFSKIPKAYDIVDWESTPPKPRKRTREGTQEHRSGVVRLPESPVKQIEDMGDVGQTQFSCDAIRTMKMSEKSVPRPMEDSSSRISYDRDSLIRLGSSPHSHVFLPCLQREDLPKEVSIFHTRKTLFPKTKVQTSGTEDKMGKMADSFELQWTIPEPVIPFVQKPPSSQEEIEVISKEFTSQVDTKMDYFTSEDGMRFKAGVSRKPTVPVRETVGRSPNNTVDLRWSDSKPVVPGEQKISHQADAIMAVTSVLGEDTEFDPEAIIKAKEKYRKAPNNKAELQWPDLKPVVPTLSESSFDWPFKTKKATGVLHTGGGNKGVEYQRTNAMFVKPGESKPTQSVFTGLEERNHAKSERDDGESMATTKQPQRKSEILFQCMEPDCIELEAPGLSGRCQKHYDNHQVSLLNRIKKIITK